MKRNRRDFIKKSSTLAAMSVAGISSSPYININRSSLGEPHKKIPWPLSEGPDTPKMVLSCPINADVKAMRRLKQIGINYVSTVWGPGPWTKAELRDYMNKFSNNGLKLINVMYIVGPDIVLGREGRDADIALLKDSLQVAGACGLPTVEYNFYVDRLIECYTVCRTVNKGD